MAANTTGWQLTSCAVALSQLLAAKLRCDVAVPDGNWKAAQQRCDHSPASSGDAMKPAGRNCVTAKVCGYMDVIPAAGIEDVR